jgi:hypothetical protein
MLLVWVEARPDHKDNTYGRRINTPIYLIPYILLANRLRGACKISVAQRGGYSQWSHAMPSGVACGPNRYHSNPLMAIPGGTNTHCHSW